MIVKMGYMLQKEERRMGGGNVSQDQTSIICIDLKSFYASVECVERGLNPFKTNLVVADPTRSKSTICLAITPAMKSLGIKNRCRIHEIPDCVKYITAMPRMQLYMDYSAKIYGIYLRYVSKEDIHVYSVDECFIDVTNYLQLYHLTAKEMAVKLMQEVMEETGITATAGVGTNLYLAKIAMDIVAKHVDDHIGILDEFSYREQLWDHKPLSDFWRIGSRTEKKLAGYGIHTMGDIAMASLRSEDWLYKMFGIDAELLIDHAWGYVIRKTAGEMIDQLTEELEIILEEKQKTELHEKYGILVDALEAAGYRYDYRESEPGHIVLAPDGTHEIAGYLQFESWGDIKDWLEDTIAEGTDISERVDRALYPFKFDYTLEEEMFRGNGDRYAIYHVDEGTPGKQHLFMNMAMVKEDGITIDAANYKCVYSGRLHENEKMDDLYAVFNDNPPADYKAHSMSVSDVIITNRGGDMQAYYVDRFGYEELPDFAAQREKILDIVPEIENVDYENDLTCISFYAAECAEFPVMGEVHYDLTLPEALEAYEKIPSERMHGLKCVGFDLKDGSDYEGMQSLMIEGKIQKEFLNSIPGFRENSYVQNAISRVEKYLEKRHPNVENPLKSNKKVDNEKNISEEKNEKELNIQMKPIPKKKRGEMSL